MWKERSDDFVLLCPDNSTPGILKVIHEERNRPKILKILGAECLKEGGLVTFEVKRIRGLKKQSGNARTFG